MRNHTRLVLVLGWVSAVALMVGSAAAEDALTRDPASLHPGRTPGLETIIRRSPGACSRTSVAMLRACKSDILDTYWTEVGKCLNLADEAERTACLADADAAYDEAQTECSDQYDAREAVCAALGQAPYDPVIVHDNFLSYQDAIANPNLYFPLEPGMSWTYENRTETIVVTVTERTIEILGVTCFVVTDVVQEKSSGKITEDTEDYYALDVDGNVWYMGELSKTLEDDQLVSLDGSWQAGRDKGRAGIVMLASPAVDVTYRQEFLLAEAEDLAQIISLTGNEQAPRARCDHDCVVTREFTPLEPGSEALKYYAPNIGLILEVDPESGDREELIGFTPSPAPSNGPGATKPPVRRLLYGVQVGPSDTPTAGAATAIQFDLSRGADVNVDVYDPAGRRIQSIFAGRRDAGRHTFEWQGTDDGGQRVPKGVYFVRIRAGAESETGKVAFLAR